MCTTAAALGLMCHAGHYCTSSASLLVKTTSCFLPLEACMADFGPRKPVLMKEAFRSVPERKAFSVFIEKIMLFLSLWSFMWFITSPVVHTLKLPSNILDKTNLVLVNNLYYASIYSFEVFC